MQVNTHQLDPALKALGFNLKGTVLSGRRFQIDFNLRPSPLHSGGMQRYIRGQHVAALVGGGWPAVQDYRMVESAPGSMLESVPRRPGFQVLVSSACFNLGALVHRSPTLWKLANSTFCDGGTG